jgi:DNA-binding GntR family transcriptional regulator
VLAVDCRNTTADACGGLDATLYAQRQAALRQDHPAFYEADDLFHAELARLSGFDGVSRMAGGAGAHLNRVRWLSLPEPHGIDDALGQHEEIAAALKAGDAQRADQVLTAHLRTVLGTLPAIRERFPGYFDSDDGGLPALPDTAGLAIGWQAGPGAGER